MTKSGLPDGVPSDNRKNLASAATFTASAEKSDSDFVAPQTVIPDFAVPASNKPSKKTFAGGTAADYSRVVVVVEDEDGDAAKRVLDKDDEDEIEPPHPPWPLLAAIAAALSLLAFYVVNQNTGEEGRPLCRDLPVWNQYNCDAG